MHLRPKEQLSWLIVNVQQPWITNLTSAPTQFQHIWPLEPPELLSRDYLNDWPAQASHSSDLELGSKSDTR